MWNTPECMCLAAFPIIVRSVTLHTNSWLNEILNGILYIYADKASKEFFCFKLCNTKRLSGDNVNKYSNIHFSSLVHSCSTSVSNGLVSSLFWPFCMLDIHSTGEGKRTKRITHECFMYCLMFSHQRHCGSDWLLLFIWPLSNTSYRLCLDPAISLCASPLNGKNRWILVRLIFDKSSLHEQFDASPSPLHHIHIIHTKRTDVNSSETAQISVSFTFYLNYAWMYELNGDWYAKRHSTAQSFVIPLHCWFYY